MMSFRSSLSSEGKNPWAAYAAGTSLITNLAGLLLYGSARGSDQLLGFASIFGAFLLFLSFTFSQLCWGSHIGRATGRPTPPWEAYFLGSLLFALALAVAGFLPLIGSGYAWAWNVFLLIGPFLVLVRSVRQFHAQSFPRFRPGLLATLAGLSLTIAATNTFVPQPFWDSLWYHLTGTRLWFDQSGYIHPEIFPPAFMTGLWDYHFLWGHLLLGGKSGTGLVAAHLFGQWATFASFLGAMAALYSVRNMFGWSGISTWAGLLASEIFALVSAAKNDWGAIFWAAAFLSFAARREKAWLLGLAAGATFSAKMTGAFFLLPLMAWVLWEKREQKTELALLGFFFAFATMPVAMRNVIFTANPFFPALASFFPEMMGPSWLNISAYEGTTANADQIARKLLSLVGENLPVIALPAFIWLRKEWPRPSALLLLATLLSAVLFLLFTSPMAEWRLAGCSLLLLTIYGFSALEYLIAKIPHMKESAPWAVMAACLLAAPLDWRAPLRLLHWTDPSLKIRESVSGAAVAWLRLNAPEGALAATLNEQRIYYFAPLPPIRAFDWPALDIELSQAPTPQAAIEAFRKRDIRYLVLSGEFLDRFFNQKICDWMFAVSEANPQAVPFRTTLSRVLDLSLVKLGNSK